jgi:3-oxoadipate enol-lactonase
VLALHGIGGGAWFFADVAARLAPGARVIAVDAPGTRPSPSAPSPVTLDSMAADLSDFVRAAVGEPVVLLGHSFGTMLALRAWDTWPAGSIRAMVFVGGLPRARPNIHERLRPRAAAIARDGLAGWGPKVSPGVFSRRSIRDRQQIVRHFERRFEAQDPRAYVRSIEILLEADLSHVVPTITVPCAAIVGEEDSYAPPEAVREFVARLPAPCPMTVLPDAAHLPFLEDPAAFAAVVDGFLQSLADVAGR